MLKEQFEKNSKTFGILLTIAAIAFALLVVMGFSTYRGILARSSRYSRSYGYNASQPGQYRGLCGARASSASNSGCCGLKNQDARKSLSQGSRDVLKDAEKAGLAYYAERYEDSSVSARATDFGCHVQVDIYKGEKVVKALGYDRESGEIYEID